MNARITDRLAARIQSRMASAAEDREAGMVTSEWAVGTVAAALAVIAAKQFVKPTVKAEEAPALATA